MHKHNPNVVCLSERLDNGGSGIEFKVIKNGEVLPAFVVRYRNSAYAYINRCSHMDLKLNFVTDNFFDFDGDHLICATHGALYAPETGACLGGPCNGLGLEPIPVVELGGKVCLPEYPGITLMNGDEL